MKVEVFRKIDRLVGVPACFLLSLFFYIKKHLFPGQKTIEQPQNILFLQLSESGAMLLTYPAIKKIKKRYPHAHIYFWAFKESSEFIDLLGVIPEENVVLMRSANIFTLLGDGLRNIREIRRWNIDTVIDMELFSRFSSVLSFLTGAKNRVGFYRYTLDGLYRGNLNTHRVAYNAYAHISKNFISLVQSLDACLDSVPLLKSPWDDSDCSLPRMSITDQDKQQLWSKLKSTNSLVNEKKWIVAINLCLDDKISIRQWPVENYLELIRKLLENTDFFVVLIGSGSKHAASILPQHERCIDLMDKVTPREMVTLFNISGMLISADGRMIHLSSLTDTPIVALFGPETPLLYGPLTKNKKIFYKGFACSPCLSVYNYKNSVCRDNQCMKAITVDEVYGTALEILGKACGVQKPL